MSNVPRTPPPIDCDRHHASLRVRDLGVAIEHYTTRLGFKLDFTWGDPVSMAGISLDRVQIFLHSGEPDPAGGMVYFVVGDADTLFAYQQANGVNVLEPPGDRSWNIRDYSVRDLDGNRLTFGHYLMSREPALEIDRVDVPVRLERRLAAVLADLASAKGMTVGECLEETLLHTFEPFPDGETVPSPHTRAHLRLIERLKAKHGVDYDCHASYRFLERGEQR